MAGRSSEPRLDGDHTAPAKPKEESGDAPHREHAELVRMLDGGFSDIS